MSTKLAPFNDEQSQLGMSFTKALYENEERIVNKRTLKPIQTISGKVAIMWFQRDFYVNDILWWYHHGIQFQFKYY